MPLLFPAKSDFEAIAASREGDLNETPFGLLLLALDECERTCVVEVQRKEVAKRVSIRRGVPVQCRSNVLQDTFACYLRDEGTISEETYIESLEEATARRAPIGDVLVERRILSSDQILSLLQKLLAKVLLDTFAWCDGSYKIIDEPTGASAPLRIRVPQLVLTGVARFVDRDLISAAVATLGEARIAQHPQGVLVAGDLRLGATENRLIQVLAEPRTVAECCELLALSQADVERSVYALGLLGLICRESDASLPSQPVPAAAGGESPFYMVRAAPRQKLTSSEIASLYLNHLRMDAFELLDVAPGAHPELIEQSYLDLLQRISPWITDAETSKRTPEQARSLLLALAVAYAELADDTARENLSQAKNDSQATPAAADKTDNTGSGSLIDPEEHYEKGLRLQKAKEYEKARECFEVASDCKPQSGRYRAEAAYSLFKQSPRLADEALEKLAESRRIDPNDGLSCLYAGEICTFLGRFDDAYNWLRAANVLMAPDRRPIDRLKELQQQRQGAETKV